jgi:outer membrane lipopolysaccharide assembly protein LptE/RlpB
MKTLYWLMAFLVATVSAGCAYKHAPLVTPVVILPQSTSDSQMQQAVRKALINHGWKIDSETLGFHHGAHSAEQPFRQCPCRLRW